MKNAFSPFCSTLNFTGTTASVFYASHVTPLHYHNTLQLVIDLKGTFRFKTEDTKWEQYSGIIIKEETIHQLDTNGSLQLIIYIDPSSKAADELKSAYLKNSNFCGLQFYFTPLEEILIYKTFITSEIKCIKILIDMIVKRITNLNSLVLCHERIQHVLELVKNSNLEHISIDYLASKVFISPSRLRMQFKQSLGVSLHKYIILQKILSAINSMINGFSVQDAAYKSGFNDTSHLNKSMLKTFSINPSMFLKGNNKFFINSISHPFELITELSPLL